MNTDTATIQEIENLLHRATQIDSANRNQIRRWLTAHGVPYAVAGRLTISELGSIYNADDAGRAAAIRRLTNDTPAQPATPATTQPTPATMTTTPAPTATHDIQAAAAALAAALAAQTPAAAPLDETKVIELINTYAPRPEPREINIRIADRPAVTIARQHYKFPLLLATIAAKIPAFLVGPAGTGKTSAAHAAALSLGLPFYAISVGPMTSKSDLFGMRDANGVYHPSDLVKAATGGGVFLFDEFDAGNAGTLTAVNMLLANGHFSTPEGMREKHPDFIPVFALNTYGTGASREYVGRNQLDAATLDRGAFLDWPLDTGLEAALVGIDEPSPAFDLAAGGPMTPLQWLDKVRAVRNAVDALKLRHVVSPRASLYGVALAAAGVGATHLADALLKKGLDAATAEKLNLKA